MSTKAKIKLIELNGKYRDAYLDYLDDFEQAGMDPEILSSFGKVTGENFSQFIERLDNNSKGIDLAEGWVPGTNYWLVCNGRILGNICLRTELNELLEEVGGHIGYSVRPSERCKGYGTLMLRLTLEKAREKKLKRVMLTCDPKNTASVKIIENNGGILHSEYFSTQINRMTRKYWIELGNS